MDEPLWYKNAVFYEVYLRAFKDADGDGIGDLQGLAQKLDYLQDLGVDCIWLMPIFPSPMKDDGYDVSDFYRIAAVYGTLDDFRAVLDGAHSRGMRLIMDLVMNHTSDQHPWFQSARSDRGSPFRDYYVWSDSDQRYREARIIFLDVESSNWTWDEAGPAVLLASVLREPTGSQLRQSKVQEEMLNVARFWLALGVDGLRADAVPYLYERDGTTCENLPETHAFLAEPAGVVDREFPGRMLLCEANEPPEDVRAYFGGRRRVPHGVSTFPLMPRCIHVDRQSECRRPPRHLAPHARHTG